MPNLSAEFLEQLTAAVMARGGTCKGGSEVIFICANPAHEDEHPSARYNGKKAAWICDACGTGGGAFDLAKLLGVPLPEASSRNGRKPKSRKTRYEIRDVRGALVAVHVRTDLADGSKAFRWTRPDNAHGLGGLPVRELPLYGAERLAGMPDGERVVICEGEKAAGSLLARGIAAVATVTGAGSTPGDGALAPLVRLRMVLWPDNDDGGRGHMTRIASRLRALGCADVRLVDWPHAQGKDDAADCGGTDDELRALFDSAQPFKATDGGEQSGGDATFGPVLVNMGAVEPEAVEWLWRDRIPRGRLTVLMGDPGVGKSFLSLAIGTAITQGVPLPGDDGARPPERVLLLTAEDALADTVRPRLDAMGADAGRVVALTGVRELDGREAWPSLSEHLLDVEAALSPGGYGLVIVDPLNAFLGSGVDAFRDNEVRSVLGPLAQLAERQGVAVLCICHLTKGRRDHALYRLQGSVGYSGAARVVLLAGEDAETGDRALVGVKSNLSQEAASIGYEIREGRFHWLGESALTSSHLLAPDGDTGERSALCEAVDFLRDALMDGPQGGKAVQREAAGLGISGATLRRARERLGVRWQQPRRSGQRGGAGVLWSLPGEQVVQSDTVSNLIGFVSETGFSGDQVGQPNQVGPDDLWPFAAAKRRAICRMVRGAVTATFSGTAPLGPESGRERRASGLRLGRAEPFDRRPPRGAGRRLGGDR